MLLDIVLVFRGICSVFGEEKKNLINNKTILLHAYTNRGPALVTRSMMLKKIIYRGIPEGNVNLMICYFVFLGGDS